MSDKPGLNGSVDLLATAMRRVFTEAVEEGVKPLRDEMGNMETRLMAHTERHVNTTNQNVQAQLADMERRMQENRSDKS